MLVTKYPPIVCFAAPLGVINWAFHIFPMRYQGKITNWKDEQGFGFITPSNGGKQVFVHIKAFSSRRRRPSGEEIVTYELNSDAAGRFQAEKVAFVGDHTASLSKGSAVLLILTILFLVFLSTLVLVNKLPFTVLALYLGASVVAFFAYANDKSAARNDRWRTPENTLHLFGVIGGWPGALVAQQLLRHKSKKRSFQIIFWITVIANCSFLGWLFSPSGSSMLRSILSAASNRLV